MYVPSNQIDNPPAFCPALTTIGGVQVPPVCEVEYTMLVPSLKNSRIRLLTKALCLKTLSGSPPMVVVVPTEEGREGEFGWTARCTTVPYGCLEESVLSSIRPYEL